jgi:hypothetical protein
LTTEFVLRLRIVWFSDEMPVLGCVLDQRLWWAKTARRQWARDVALLEIQKLADDERYVAAFDEAVRAEGIILSLANS